MNVKDVKTLAFIGILVMLFLVGTSFLSFFLGSMTEALPEATASYQDEFSWFNWFFGFCSLLTIGGGIFILLQRSKKPQRDEGEEYVLKKLR